MLIDSFGRELNVGDFILYGRSNWIRPGYLFSIQEGRNWRHERNSLLTFTTITCGNNVTQTFKRTLRTWHSWSDYNDRPQAQVKLWSVLKINPEDYPEQIAMLQDKIAREERRIARAARRNLNTIVDLGRQLNNETLTEVTPIHMIYTNNGWVERLPDNDIPF